MTRWHDQCITRVRIDTKLPFGRYSASLLSDMAGLPFEKGWYKSLVLGVLTLHIYLSISIYKFLTLHKSSKGKHWEEYMTQKNRTTLPHLTNKKQKKLGILRIVLKESNIDAIFGHRRLVLESKHAWRLNDLVF